MLGIIKIIPIFLYFSVTVDTWTIQTLWRVSEWKTGCLRL